MNGAVMSKSRRIAQTTTIPLAITAFALTVGIGFSLDRSDSDEQTRVVETVRVVDALEVAPTRTVSDWAKVADYVVTASVVSERPIEELRSSETSIDTETMVLREVTLQTSELVWRAPSSKLELPPEFAVRAMGWLKTEGGALEELALENGSRLEVGHRYLIGLTWKPAQCSEGDTPEPARWAVIGSNGALPADDGMVGKGEIEGTETERSALPPDTVLGQLAGQDASAMAPLLGNVPAAQLGINKVGPFRPQDDSACGSSN